ncbi:MAG: DUF2157 domain-containing protein [Treponema sp.]|nr:DUF2157 domain-containing protein [Treponema sp.]
MEKVHVDWLLDELKVLVQKGVVSNEVSSKISDYYKKAESSEGQKVSPEKEAVTVKAGEKAAEKNSGGSIYKIINERNKKSAPNIPTITTEQIPVVLSVMASILIAAGVISLIAYNWNAIPRFAKAVAAFVMLLAVQALSCFVMFKKDLFCKKHWREGSAVLWSLLFGGAVAFISQICRLPGNTSAFLFVWSISSILIMYAMNSTGVFFIALAQSVAYALSYSQYGGGAFGFYFLFAAIFPFARTKKYALRIMLCLAALMLCCVLEKAIPGLWIVCSVSFAVLCLEYAIAHGDTFIKRLSFAGLCILLLLLTINGFWKEIGWKYMRPNYNLLGSIMDCVLALGLTIAAVSYPLIPVIKKTKKASYELAYSFCALLVAILYVIYALMERRVQNYALLAPTAIAYLFAMLFFVHIFCSKNSSAIVFLLCLAVSICSAQFSNIILAALLLMLLLESFLQYQLLSSGKEDDKVESKSGFFYLFIRISFFIALALIAYNSSWLDFNGKQYSSAKLFLLPLSHFALYALCAAGALYLIKKASFAKRSLDIIFISAAILILFIVNAFVKINEQTLCFVLFCIEFTACAYVFFLNQKEKTTNPLYFWAPFAFMAAYYFWANLSFDYPLLAIFAFLLLFECLGRYRSKEYEAEGNAVYFFVRLALAFLFIAIGFEEVRPILKYLPSNKALPFQMAVYAFYAIAALVLLVLSKRWLYSLDALIFMAIMAFMVFVLDKSSAEGASLVASNSRALGKPQIHPSLIFSTLYYALSFFASVYGIYLWKKKKSLLCLPYLLLLAVNQFFAQDNLFYGGNFIVLAIPLCALVYYYTFDSEKYSSLATISEAIFAITVFAAAFIEISLERLPFINGNGQKDYPYLLSCLLHTLLYASIVFLPLVHKTRGKAFCNYFIAFYALAIFVLLASCEIAPVFGYELKSGIVSLIFILLSFVTIFVNCGYYIFKAYRTKNLALANAAGGLACLSIIIKFFSDDFGFVVKGVVFIVLGILMLILNMFLLRLNASSGESEVKND